MDITPVKKNTNAQRQCTICNEEMRGDKIIRHIIKHHTQQCFDSHTQYDKNYFKQNNCPFIAVYSKKRLCDKQKAIDCIACLHCGKGATMFSKDTIDGFRTLHYKTCKYKEVFQTYASNYDTINVESIQQVETNGVTKKLQAFMNATKEHGFENIEEALDYLLKSYESNEKTIDKIHKHNEKQKTELREEHNEIQAELQLRISNLEHIVETLRPSQPELKIEQIPADEGIKYWDEIIFRLSNYEDPNPDELRKDYYDNDIDIEEYLQNNNNASLKKLFNVYVRWLNREICWNKLIEYTENNEY